MDIRARFEASILLGELRGQLQAIARFTGSSLATDAGATLDDLEAALRPITDPRDDEIAELKSSVVAFGGPWAVRYAADIGLPPGDLHPTHYDILARCGARMDDFRRADPSSPEEANNGGAAAGDAFPGEACRR